MRAHVRRGLIAALLLAGGLAQIFAQSTPIQYVYDELGRLVGVIDATGNAAIYSYDAVGNLLSIARPGSNAVSIIEFTPNSGLIGTLVTIHGTGFSATPSQNTVTFNGTPATVSSASVTKLTASVPSGATTGAIAVTTPLGSATSTVAFTVTAGDGAPTITSFSPAMGMPGTSVTITGTNFNASLVYNRLKQNEKPAQLQSVTGTTQLTATVPPYATSGPWTLMTPFGIGFSASDFFVPPTPYGVSDVEYTARLTPGTPHPVTISTATKIALLTFGATAGERISVHLSVGPIGVFRIFDPNGAEVVSSAMTLSTVFIDTTALNITGTYTAMVDPSNANTGSITVTLSKVPPDVSGPIVADGSGVSGSITTPGQNMRLTFSGTTGQRVSAKATVTSGSFGCVWYLKVLKADGTSLGSVNSCGPTPFLDPVVLPDNATYTLLADPEKESTGTVTLNLYSVTDVTNTISADGSPYVATTTTPGQNVRLTFTGTAGQRVSAKGTVTAGSWGCVWWLKVLKADGTAVGNTSSCGSAFLEPVALPEAGTYTLLADPEAANTGTASLNLYTVVDATGSLTLGAAAQTVSLNTPGQNATFTFAGTANQQVTVRLTTNSFGTTTVKLLKPDGTQLTSSTSASASFNLSQQTLPTGGTYSVLIDPSSTNTGSIAVQVTSP